MNKNHREELENLRIAGLGAKQMLEAVKKRYAGQVGVLTVLVEEDGITQSDISEILDIKPSSVAEFVKKLERANLIKRESDTLDKRSKRVFITEEGRSFVEKTVEESAKTKMPFFSGLTEEEITQLAQLLEKLMDGWDDTFLENILDTPKERMQQFREFERFDFDRANLFNHDFQRDMHQMMRERKMNPRQMHQWTREFQQEKRQLRSAFNEQRKEMREMPWKERKNKEREIKMQLWENLHEKMFGSAHPFSKQRAEKATDESEWKDF